MKVLKRKAVRTFYREVEELRKAVTTGDAGARLPDRIGIDKACECLVLVCKILQFADEGDVEGSSKDELVKLVGICKSLREYYK